MRVAIRILLTLLGIAVILLGLALITLNDDSVHVQLGVFDVPPLPLGILLAATLGVGAMLGFLVTSPFLLRSASRRRRLTRRVGELDREVHELRTLPLRGDG